MAVMLRQQYADLFFSRLPFIDEILFEYLKAPEVKYPRVFNVRDSQRAFEETTGFTGFGLFPTLPEGDKVQYDTILQGFDKRYTHVDYSMGFQISKQGMRDDIDGVISDAAPALGRSATNSIETVIWNVFNNGFPTGTELTPDGVTLFNDSHPLVGGGTFDNLVSGDLSVANLESAINVFDDMRDDRNLLVNMEPSILLIPPELRWLAHEILRSEKRSNTADNATNAFNQIGMDIVMVKYLTGDDDWFVGTPPQNNKLLVYWREQPVTDHTLDFDTSNMKTKMSYAFSVGASDWRGWVGGQGA